MLKPEGATHGKLFLSRLNALLCGIMSKQDYVIFAEAGKGSCKNLLDKYHYLSKIGNGFKSGYNFILWNTKKDEAVGVCIFTGFPVPELVKGMYGLDRKDQKGFFELSRLCLEPNEQNKEHNLASWFVSRCIRHLKRLTKVRAILSYADDDHHKGVVYRACNFDYYGLTDKKKDFWILQDNGSYKKHSRGKTKGVAGEWRDRSRKHRFVMTFDKALDMLWNKST